MQGVALATVIGSLTLVLCAPASASSVVVLGRQAVVYESAPPPGDVNDVTVSADGATLIVTDTAGMFAGQGCELATPTRARCTGVQAGIQVDTGSKNDRVVLDRTLTAFLAHDSYSTVYVQGGAGDDRLQGMAPPKGYFHSVLLRGGSGADDLSGAGDVADYSDATGGGVSVTLDGVANDGNADDESAGRRDNVGAGMSVTGTDAADVLVGDAADNVLDGGGGDDQITGGKGHDSVSGGDGNDEVDIRDGVADSVGCGPGTDHVRSDSRALDSVAAKNCESVDALAGPCEAMDRFNAAHAKPKRFGGPARPKAGGLYLGKTSFGLPVRLNIARSRRSFVPASRFSYKWCFQERVEPVDLKISGDAIKPDGSFDIVHQTANGFGVRRVRGRFWDHGRKVSGVITDRYGSRAHGGPVTFVATLTPRK